MAFLPADRQVRPQSLLAFLPWATPETTVISTYVTPPSGESRRLISLVFQFLGAGIGRMRVHYAGSYMFHRRWLETIDLHSVRSETFVFSFELLEKMRQAGSRFAAVHHPPVRARGGTEPRSGPAPDCAGVRRDRPLPDARWNTTTRTPRSLKRATGRLR